MTTTDRPRVLAPSRWYDARYMEPARTELEKAGVDIKFAKPETIDEFVAAAQDVDAMYQSSFTVTGDILRQLPRLRVWCAAGIGFDNVDVDAATELGILIVNIPRVFHREVAHHAWALLLGLIREVVTLNDHMKSKADQIKIDGPASRPARYPRQHIYGQTLGLVSFGNIARVVAQIAKPFELNVIAYDPFVSQAVADDHGVRLMPSLEALFAESDFISVHTPLSKATHHLIGEQHFRACKPTALFVNTARGPIVDEAALIRALQEGWIAGAGLDVQEKEPPDTDNPLLKMENVILTPHVASASDFAGVERVRWMGIEVARVLTGKWPINGLVNKTVAPRFPLTPD